MADLDGLKELVTALRDDVVAWRENNVEVSGKIDTVLVKLDELKAGGLSQAQQAKVDEIVAIATEGSSLAKEGAGTLQGTEDKIDRALA